MAGLGNPTQSSPRRAAPPPPPSPPPAPPPPAPDRPSFGDEWRAFTAGARVFLVPRQDDRSLDQFLILRDRVYEIIQSNRFIERLDISLSFAPEDVNGVPAELAPQFREAMLEELRACTRAGEVLLTTEPNAGTTEEGRNKIKGQLSKLSTTLGSLKEVAGDVPYLKTGLALYKELVDYFK